MQLLMKRFSQHMIEAHTSKFLSFHNKYNLQYSHYLYIDLIKINLQCLLYVYIKNGLHEYQQYIPTISEINEQLAFFRDIF